MAANLSFERFSSLTAAPAFLVQRHIGPPAESNESLKFIDVWKERSELMRGPYIVGDRIYVDGN